MVLRLVGLAAQWPLCNCHYLISAVCHSTALRKEVPVGITAALCIISRFFVIWNEFPGIYDRNV